MQKCVRCGNEFDPTSNFIDDIDMLSAIEYFLGCEMEPFCPDCLENLKQKIDNTVDRWLTINGNYGIDKKTKGGYKVIVSGKNQDAFAKYVGWIYTKGEWLAAYWDSEGHWKSGPFTTSDTEYDLVFLKDL